ncbi:MAG: pyridoxal phosphate-dependent aminotransferase [Acidobacteria bacterium]|nr:MAG: pyridoxal phosphate-dependent aminotransferase [Acidobacteriota bacterium]REK00112.1 MAG: pyridoxal phosphate-dependent aminotransferase [Acidobacteriota bacterium]
MTAATDTPETGERLAEPAPAQAAPILPGFRTVPRTGVIFVMHRAERAGYGSDGQTWVNLGQGSPEVGPLPGAPPRLETIEVDPSHRAYAPIQGLGELREAVAAMYNRTYRRGLPSQYSAENVCIAPGGRAAMTRVAAAIGPANLGHFLPDYTAYEELLFTFRGFIPIPILLEPSEGYRIGVEALEREMVGRGLAAVLFSNPSNPTGQTVLGERLQGFLAAAKRSRCAMVLDEFYSHYLYAETGTRGSGRTSPEGVPPTVSGAAYVEDVDRDPVLLVDGLTKNWRYPGLRIAWIVGPRSLIEQTASAGSFLDGGASRPTQQATLPLLEADHVVAETRAIQSVFANKRAFMLQRLRQLGVRVESEPTGAFYVWGELSGLPEPLRDGTAFFERALERRVITVPGVFFDVNPGRRRSISRFGSYSRFSFGSEMHLLQHGLDALEQLIGELR